MIILKICKLFVVLPCRRLFQYFILSVQVKLKGLKIKRYEVMMQSDMQ